MGRGVCAEIIAPKGTKILPTKWVYDDKIGLDSRVPTIVRLKARLTAMGIFSERILITLILSPRL
jgi:hypothetical protein